MAGGGLIRGVRAAVAIHKYRAGLNGRVLGVTVVGARAAQARLPAAAAAAASPQPPLIA